MIPDDDFRGLWLYGDRVECRTCRRSQSLPRGSAPEHAAAMFRAFLSVHRRCGAVRGAPVHHPLVATSAGWGGA